MKIIIWSIFSFYRKEDICIVFLSLYTHILRIYIVAKLRYVYVLRTKLRYVLRVETIYIHPNKSFSMYFLSLHVENNEEKRKKKVRMKKWERHKKSLCEYWYVSPQGNCIFKTWSAAVLCFNFLFEEVETHKQSFQVSHANMNWKTNTDTQIQNILACVA